MTAAIPFPGIATGIVRERFPYVWPGTGFVVPAESAAGMTSGVVAVSSLTGLRPAYPGRRPAVIGAFTTAGPWVVLGIYDTPQEADDAIAALLSSIADDRAGSRRARR